MTKDDTMVVRARVTRKTADVLWKLAESRGQKTMEFLRDLLEKICEN